MIKKENKKKSFFSKSMKRLGNVTWVICILMGLQSFTYKLVYPTVIGIMFIMLSFIFFPWQEKILSYFNIKLTNKQKLFIGFGMFFTATYSVSPYETNFLKCILSFFIMILIWILTFIYSRYKSYIRKEK